MSSRAAPGTRGPLPSPAGKGPLPRKCACGTHAAGGTCETCRRKNEALQRSHRSASPAPQKAGNILPFARHLAAVPVRAHPGKSLGPAPEEDDREKPSPNQGSATIQCDGSGGYEIVYNGWAGATCGTKGCVTVHEGTHIADWRAKWPNGCAGQAKGYLPKGDPPDNPLMSASEYRSFLKASECRAHTADLQCAEALPKQGACRQTVEDYIKLTRSQKDAACGGLSRGTKILIGLAGGAGVGAGIGYLLGGGMGAAIGAGVGALAGLIGGIFA